MEYQTFAVLPLSANAVSREGFDLVECTWKLSAKQKEQGITKEMRAPKMVYLPSLETQLIARLGIVGLDSDCRQVIYNAIDAQRNAIVKALIESGSNVIPGDSVHVDVCILSMLAEKETERLNGERIEAWFANCGSFQEYIQAIAEEKSAQSGKALAMCIAERKNVYLATIKKLAAPNPGISENDRDKLVDVLQMHGDASSTCQALIRKAQNIQYYSAL